jgi:hypothetical protein
MSPARKPPHNVHVLQRWVGDLAREQGIAPGRVQRWISFMVVAAMLDHARDEDGDPLFLLKGGAAMELRLGLRARATKDYDTAYREATEGMLERLDTALRHGFSGRSGTSHDRAHRRVAADLIGATSMTAEPQARIAGSRMDHLRRTLQPTLKHPAAGSLPSTSSRHDR